MFLKLGRDGKVPMGPTLEIEGDEEGLVAKQSVDFLVYNNCLK